MFRNEILAEDLGALYRTVLNVDLMPAQEDVVKTAWGKNRGLVVTYPGWGKSFLIAAYALLSAWAGPGKRVACFSPSWRQSRIIFDYMVNIIKNSPVLMTSIRNYSIENDRWDVTFHGTHNREDQIFSNIRSFSLDGNCGRYFKGYRCHTLLIDEAINLPENIFNTVLRPITMTNWDPMLSVKYRSDQEKIKGLYLFSEGRRAKLLEELDTIKDINLPLGQTLMFTGSYYKHNYVYQLYQRYLADIEHAFVKTYAWYQAPPGALDLRSVMDAKKDMPEEMFKILYECEWLEGK
jgi:hypothetical protein